MTWNEICESRSSVNIDRAIHDYKLYIIEQELDLTDLCDILGYKYFQDEMCLDEIIEQFNNMILSKYVYFLTDMYLFVIFFFKKQLYNKKISLDEAKVIHKKYLKPMPYNFVNEYKKNETKYRETEFVTKMVLYKNAEHLDQDYVYETFYQYLQDLNFN